MALYMMRRGRFVAFIILSMPMSLFLMGSLSQDALLLSISALFLAGMSRKRDILLAPSFKDAIFYGLLLMALGMGRPTLLVLGILFLLPPWCNWLPKSGFLRPTGLIVVCTVAGSMLLWLSLIQPLQVDFRGGTSVSGQLRFLANHLHLIPNIVFNSLHGAQFLFTVGGVFGSLGVFHSSLPLAFYALAAAALTSAFVLEAGKLPSGAIWQRRAIGVAAVGGIVGTYFVIHLTWSPVGQLEVDGVQGRYLVPFLMLGGMGAALGWSLNKRIVRLFSFVILIMPLVGCAVSVVKIWVRYS